MTSAFSKTYRTSATIEILVSFTIGASVVSCATITAQAASAARSPGKQSHAAPRPAQPRTGRDSRPEFHPSLFPPWPRHRTCTNAARFSTGSNAAVAISWASFSASARAVPHVHRNIPLFTRDGDLRTRTSRPYLCGAYRTKVRPHRDRTRSGRHRADESQRAAGDGCSRPASHGPCRAIFFRLCCPAGRHRRGAGRRRHKLRARSASRFRRRCWRSPTR
jgi:hypothetical protein